jgi:hypothetical protein
VVCSKSMSLSKKREVVSCSITRTLNSEAAGYWSRHRSRCTRFHPGGKTGSSPAAALGTRTRHNARNSSASEARREGGFMPPNLAGSFAPGLPKTSDGQVAGQLLGPPQIHLRARTKPPDIDVDHLRPSKASGHRGCPLSRWTSGAKGQGGTDPPGHAGRGPLGSVWGPPSADGSSHPGRPALLGSTHHWGSIDSRGLRRTLAEPVQLSDRFAARSGRTCPAVRQVCRVRPRRLHTGDQHLCPGA